MGSEIFFTDNCFFHMCANTSYDYKHMVSNIFVFGQSFSLNPGKNFIGFFIQLLGGSSR